jgi:type II secretory pathway predicted ATPase ExeA
MYRNFFGLRDTPFAVSPDPRYLYRTKAIQEALAGLTYGIESRKGFLLLTGEVGTGKTTLLNRLLDWLREKDVATAYVFNSQHLSVRQLFDFILADFGIATDLRVKSQMLMKLNQWLLERYRKGKTTVLIIDEAQNLSESLLEEVRLLTNLETPNGKLLQIILSGQPELEEIISRPQLRQLRQRIMLRCKTLPLTQEETHAYIAERLRVAGSRGEPIFSHEAIDAIYGYAHGIPRVVNLLCEHSLINAFADEIKPIPAQVVDVVASEFQLDTISPVARQSPSPLPPTPSGEESVRSSIVQVETLLQNLRSFLYGAESAQRGTAAGTERKS